MRLKLFLLMTTLITPVVTTSIQAASSSLTPFSSSSAEGPTLFDLSNEIKSCILGLITEEALPKEGKEWGQRLSEKLDYTMKEFLNAYINSSTRQKILGLGDLVSVIRVFIEGSYLSDMGTEFANRLLRFVKVNFTDNGIKLNLRGIETAWEEEENSRYRSPRIQEALEQLISANRDLP